MTLLNESFAGVILSLQYLFTGYPVARRLAVRRDLAYRVLLSHVLSVAIVVGLLFLAYAVAQPSLLLVLEVLVVATGILGLSRFLKDMWGAGRGPIRDRQALATLGIVAAAVLFMAVYGETFPFQIASDPYQYYVPIGRYLNSNLASYGASFYRFDLSRDFGYYAVYANADWIGRVLSTQAYRLLPVPFVVGITLSGYSLAKRVFRSPYLANIALALLVFSVFFSVLVRYDVYYLGNTLMITGASFFALLLLDKDLSAGELVVLALFCFAMPLIYDFSIILVIAFAVAWTFRGGVRHAPVGVVMIGAMVALGYGYYSEANLSVGTLASLVLSPFFLAALTVVGLCPLILRLSFPARFDRGTSLISTSVAATVASVLVAELFSLLRFGFLSLEAIKFPASVTQFMVQYGWFYSPPLNVGGSTIVFFLSGVLFGWGLPFVVYGFLQSSKKFGNALPVYFACLLMLAFWTQAFNGTYYRFVAFFAPVLIVFLCLGVYSLLGRYSLHLVVPASLVSLLWGYWYPAGSLDQQYHFLFNSFELWFLSAACLLVLVLVLAPRLRTKMAFASGEDSP